MIFKKDNYESRIEDLERTVIDLQCAVGDHDWKMFSPDHICCKNCGKKPKSKEEDNNKDSDVLRDSYELVQKCNFESGHRTAVCKKCFDDSWLVGVMGLKYKSICIKCKKCSHEEVFEII